MAKSRHSITVENQIWTRATQHFDNLSQTIETLLRQELNGIDPDDSPGYQDRDIINQMDLTDKQKQALRYMIDDQVNKITASEFAEFCDKHNLYTREDHIKDAFTTFDKRPGVPYRIENGKLRAEIVEHECGNKNSILLYSDGACPSCGTKVISLPDETDGFTVVNND